MSMLPKISTKWSAKQKKRVKSDSRRGKKKGKVAFIPYDQVIIKDSANEQTSKSQTNTKETYKQTNFQPSQTSQGDTEKRKRSISRSPKTYSTPDAKLTKLIYLRHWETVEIFYQKKNWRLENVNRKHPKPAGPRGVTDHHLSEKMKHAKQINKPNKTNIDINSNIEYQNTPNNFIINTIRTSTKNINWYILGLNEVRRMG